MNFNVLENVVLTRNELSSFVSVATSFLHLA